ncbi:hypothetical protein PSTG_03049 [Puccinia striiformis f. sp. tritici PST-78]|uniref:Uncharacterized protein n=2 Tax=Puccinia striiformis f. sp. tritici PST-78 TaxID=1165861 RepID=A0A0L0VXJ0_9BASI|nr:hypothetical protein PSTG_03049 [Puccinia striiformis f. sp. tritici PST-78]
MNQRTSAYSISTSEIELGKCCWEVKDRDGHLVFKSCKELTHDEIIEGVQDTSGRTLWTIRRPIKGWYLVIQSPLDSNPQNFVALEPRNVIKGKNKRVDFSFRLQSTSTSSSSSSSSSSITTTADTIVDMPVHNSHIRKDSTDSTIKRRIPSASSSPQSPNRLKPNLDQQQQQQQKTTSSTTTTTTPSLTEEIVICLQSVDLDLSQQTYLNSFKNLFTNNPQNFQCFLQKSTTDTNDDSSSDPPVMINHNHSNPNIQITHDHDHDHQDPSILLDYQDRNESVFGIHNNGILRIKTDISRNKFKLIDSNQVNIGGENQLQLHTSFWVAISIAYLGFRADQDAYNAANQED